MFPLLNGKAKPLQFLDGCEGDFDKNGRSDIALLYKTSSSTELTVILSFEKKTKAYLLYQGMESNIEITCLHTNDLQVIETDIGHRKLKTININGAYIEFSQSESSNSIFYWRKNKFIQEWTSD